MFDFFKTSAFICYPNLVVSDISSTNLKHVYNLFSIAEFNYYLKCFIDFSFVDYHFIYLSLLNSNNIEINNNDTYKTYLRKVIYSYFYNNEKSNRIINRIDSTLFTINELKYILNRN